MLVASGASAQSGRKQIAADPVFTASPAARLDQRVGRRLQTRVNTRLKTRVDPKEARMIAQPIIAPANTDVRVEATVTTPQP
ncbi:MAG: hypothetical protein EOO77_16485 [Oxalobacteraceae bacterium]|nr:MAG: hypothetical protein EOO77_16485 [Oxalobacteraceae bacterium]